MNILKYNIGWLSILIIIGLLSGSVFSESTNSSIRILPSPVLFFTPETGWAGGAVGLLYYNILDDKSIKPNTVTVSAVYSEKKQIRTFLKFLNYFHDNKKKLELELQYYKFPINYYGLGPDTKSMDEETITPRGFESKGDFQIDIYNKLYIGPAYRYVTYKIVKIDSGSLLERTDITGKRSTDSFGFGLNLTWDKRDRLFFPLKGYFIKFQPLFYNFFLPEKSNFSITEVDTRYYYQLSGYHVLAFQYQALLGEGYIPLRILPRLGGVYMMRGYFDGRYTDKTFMASQIEYRFPIIWRINGVVFGSMGQVSSSLRTFTLDNFKSALGAGLRIVVDKDEYVTLRADFAVSRKDGSQIYFSGLEAF